MTAAKRHRRDAAAVRASQRTLGLTNTVLARALGPILAQTRLGVSVAALAAARGLACAHIAVLEGARRACSKTRRRIIRGFLEGHAKRAYQPFLQVPCAQNLQACRSPTLPPPELIGTASGRTAEPPGGLCVPPRSQSRYRDESSRFERWINSRRHCTRGGAPRGWGAPLCNALPLPPSWSRRATVRALPG